MAGIIPPDRPAVGPYLWSPSSSYGKRRQINRIWYNRIGYSC